MSSAGARRFRSFEERTIEALLKDEQQFIQRLKTNRTETGGFGDSIATGDSIGSGPREAAGNSLQKRGDTMGGPISYAPVTVTITIDGGVNNNTIAIGANSEAYGGFIKLDAIDPSTDLHTLRGIFYPGQDIFLQGIIGKTVVIKDTGNIITPSGDFNLVGNAVIRLIYDPDITKWILYTSGSGSGGGGGGAGLNWKLPARVLSDLTATLTHDFSGDYIFIQSIVWNTSTDLAPGERILLVGENPAEFRGLWIITDTTKDIGGAGIQYKVIRPTDFDTDTDVISESFVPIEEGNFKNTLWHLTTDNPITLGDPIPIGGTPQTWVEFAPGGGGGEIVSVEINLGNVSGGQDVDWSLANKFRCVMVGDTTFSMINTPPVSSTWQRIVLEAKQDGTGGRIASFADSFENDNFPITLTSPNAYSIWSFYASNRGTQPVFSFNTLQFYSVTYIMSDEETPLDPSSDTDPFSTFGAETSFVINEVKARVRTAPIGSDLTIDIHVNGTSILSTKITIEDSEKTSQSAGTQPVIIPASSQIGNDDLIELFLDARDSGMIATGLKITIGGHVT